MFSYVEQRGQVDFPEWKGESIYMKPFFNPKSLGRWSQTVIDMLAGVDTKRVKYLMVDEGLVIGGEHHRRSGVHIDGHWVSDLTMHGSPSPGHTLPGHPPGHKTPGRHNGPLLGSKEAVILATNIQATRGYVGHFNETIGAGGDCSHIPLDKMRAIDLRANTVYAGNVYFLHESLPVSDTCRRTVVRINVPGWEPEMEMAQ